MWVPTESAYFNFQNHFCPEDVTLKEDNIFNY